jgi:GNAT superfamily N-acetyltransferase
VTGVLGSGAIHLRPMHPGDAGDVVELTGQLGYGVTSAEVIERLAHIAGDPDHRVLVAEAGESRLLGWVHVRGSRLIEAEPAAEIGGLVVAEGARRAGVGGALLAAAEDWAIQSGYRLVRVRSNVVREGAHRFYEAVGYFVAKTSYTFEKTLPPTPSQREGE